MKFDASAEKRRKNDTEKELSASSGKAGERQAMAKAKANPAHLCQTITTRLTHNGACGSMKYGLANTHTQPTHTQWAAAAAPHLIGPSRTPIRIRNRARFAHLNLYRNLI